MFLELGMEDFGVEFGMYSIMYLVSVKNYILYICLIFYDILGIFLYYCSWVFFGIFRSLYSVQVLFFYYL